MIGEWRYIRKFQNTNIEMTLSDFFDQVVNDFIHSVHSPVYCGYSQRTSRNCCHMASAEPAWVVSSIGIVIRRSAYRSAIGRYVFKRNQERTGDGNSLLQPTSSLAILQQIPQQLKQLSCQAAKLKADYDKCGPTPAPRGQTN